MRGYVHSSCYVMLDEIRYERICTYYLKISYPIGNDILGYAFHLIGHDIIKYYIQWIWYFKIVSTMRYIMLCYAYIWFVKWRKMIWNIYYFSMLDIYLK